MSEKENDAQLCEPCGPSDESEAVPVAQEGEPDQVEAEPTEVAAPVPIGADGAGEQDEEPPPPAGDQPLDSEAADCLLGAENHHRAGRLEHALADYSRAIAKAPNCWQAYLQRGQVQRALGHLTAAIADFTIAIENQPEFVDAYLERGQAHLDARSPRQATADYDVVLRFQPDCAVAHLNRSLACARLGIFDQVFPGVEAALRLDDGLTSAYFIRGVAHAGRGDYENAVTDFTTYLQANPRDALAYNERGLAHAQRQDHDRAVADYQRALRYNPKLSLARFNLGVAQRCRGAVAESIAVFDLLLSEHPRSAQGYYQRGLAHSDAGHRDLALADLNRAVRINPGLEAARQARENLRRADNRMEGKITHEPRCEKPVAAGASPPPAGVARPDDDAKSLRTAGTEMPSAASSARPSKAQSVPPWAAQSGPPANPAERDHVQLECPACGAPGKVRRDRLNRQFVCKQCKRLFGLSPGGRLQWIGGPRMPRESWLVLPAQWRAMAASALVLFLVGGAAWALWPSGRSLPPLPTGLEARAKLMAQSWLQKDPITMRRLTARRQGSDLRRWHAKHRSPEGDTEDAQISLQLVRQEKDTALLVLLIQTSSGNHALPQHWIKEQRHWVFTPEADTKNPASSRSSNRSSH